MPQNFYPARDATRTLQGIPARITLFVGAYGSGKSEISVNFALWLARWARQPGQRVVLCDLDTINPYYRSADARSFLAANDIELIAPMYAGTNVDVPAVPSAVFSVFDDPAILAVLDIGGEDLGARVVGSLRSRLIGQDYAINYVVNPFRPLTADAAGIARTAAELAAAMGLPLTGIVDNANLLEPASLTLLTESLPVVAAGARLADLNILFAAAMTDAAAPSDFESAGVAWPAEMPLLYLVRSIYYSTDPAAQQPQNG